MNLDIQFKLKNNPNYVQYLHENSSWYKYLNRNPEKFDIFVAEVKEKYKLRPSDKLSSVLSKIEFVQQFINVLK